MEEFCNKSEYQPFKELVTKLKGDHNVIFVQMANMIRAKGVNNIGFCSDTIKAIIELSPLNNSSINDTKMNPLESYRWLYLLFFVSSAKNEDCHFEHAKNEYILSVLNKSFIQIPAKSSNSVSFLMVILVFLSRFIDSTKCDPKVLNNEAFYNKLLELSEFKYENDLNIKIEDFPKSDLFLFFSPISLELLSSSSLFKSLPLLIVASVLRLLNRLYKVYAPAYECEKFKHLVQRMSQHSEIASLSFDVLKLLFNGNEEKALLFKENELYKNTILNINDFCRKTNDFSITLTFSEQVRLSKEVEIIYQSCQKNPKIWSSFLNQNPDILATFVSLMLSDYDSSFVICCAYLINMGRAKVNCLKRIIELFISSKSDPLKEQLSGILLNHYEDVSTMIAQYLPIICRYGSRSTKIFDFLKVLISKIENPNDLLQSIYKTLHEEFESIKNHPNYYIYQQLQNYIAVEGSYLDQQPCNVCNNPELQTIASSLRSYFDSQKFQHDHIYAKLTTPLLISSLSINYNPKRRTKVPRTIKMYVSSIEVSNPNDLLNESHQWIHAADFCFNQSEHVCIINFPLKLFASNIRFHFFDFWEENTEKKNIKCNSCHIDVDSRSGLCPKCRENIYMCRQCRNINYNHLDGFICYECGFSSYIDIDWSVNCVPSFSHTHIMNEKEADLSINKADELLATVQDKYNIIAQLKSKIELSLSPSKIPTNQKINELNSLYNDQSKSIYNELTNRIQHINSIRNSVALFYNYCGINGISDSNLCYNCRNSFIIHCLVLIGSVSSINGVDSKEATEVLLKYADHSSYSTITIESLISFCKVRHDLSDKIVLLFKNSLPNPSPHMIKLLIALLQIKDGSRIHRFESIIQCIIDSSKYIMEISSIIPVVIHPLINAVFESTLIIRSAKLFNLYVIMSNWRSSITPHTTSILNLFPDCTIVELLTNSQSSALRQLVAMVLSEQSVFSEENTIKTYEFVTKQLFSIKCIENTHYDLIKILGTLLQNPFIVGKPFLIKLFPNIIGFFFSDSERVLRSEKSLVLDLNVGSSIFYLVSILDQIFQNQILVRYFINMYPNDISKYCVTYYRLKSLIVQRSKYLQDTISLMKTHLILLSKGDFVIPVDEENKVIYSNLKGQTIFIVSSFNSIKYSIDICIKELHTIMFPPVIPKNIPIIAIKTRTQEDFIPGRISRDPFFSHQVGQLMRDIKNKICTDLRMEALMNDDRAMELLVNNQIVSLGLQIEDVYNKVWLPFGGESPMEVVFRLQGLDGEATEPIINSFPREVSNSIDPIVKYGYSRSLIESGGILLMIQSLSSIKSESVFGQAIDILSCFMVIGENMNFLVTNRLVNELFRAIKQWSIKIESTQTLISGLLLVSTLLKTDPTSIDDIEHHLEYVFSMIVHPVVLKNEILLPHLLSLLPILASTSQSRMEQVLQFFIKKLKPQHIEGEFNYFKNNISSYYLHGFSEFSLALPSNETGNSIRDIIIREGFVHDAIKYLHSIFDLSHSKLSKEWTNAINDPILPSLLKTLSGMCQGHKSTQSLFIEDNNYIIRVMIRLSGMSSSNSIGEFANHVITNSEKEPSICRGQISLIRNEIIQSAREKAKDEKSKSIQRISSGVSFALTSMLEEIDDENGWECCICKEGYSFLPNESLGFYAQRTKIEGYMSVSTHFICIHNKCHQKASQTEKRNPSNEWTAASVRNCERPCNTIFPIPSSSKNDSQYINQIASFFGVSNSSNLAPILLHEIEYHIYVLSQENPSPRNQSFENEIAIIPYILYPLLIVLTNQSFSIESEPIKAMHESIMQFLYQQVPVTNLFSTALVSLNNDEWEEHKVSFIRAALLPFKDAEPSNVFDIIKKTLGSYILLMHFKRLLQNQSSNWMINFSEQIIKDPTNTIQKWKALSTIANDVYKASTIDQLLQLAEIQYSNAENWVRKNE